MKTLFSLFAFVQVTAFADCRILQERPKGTWIYVAKVTGGCLNLKDGDGGLKHGEHFIMGIASKSCRSLNPVSLFKTAAAADAACKIPF